MFGHKVLKGVGEIEGKCTSNIGRFNFSTMSVFHGGCYIRRGHLFRFPFMNQFFSTTINSLVRSVLVAERKRKGGQSESGKKLPNFFASFSFALVTLVDGVKIVSP